MAEENEKNGKKAPNFSVEPSLTPPAQGIKPLKMSERPNLRLNLARKYRPQSLEEMTGQTSVVKILQEALKRDRIAPAYLFSGPRGVGKTSSARIFAKAASCLSKEPEARPCNVCKACEGIQQTKFMDILEIDGASHTGVDDVRSLIESAAYRPSVGARKVYIIDEVHMLSNAAFNALLKTLEEPPPHALFLMATTEPEKLPTTILSRVHRLELQRLKEREIFENLHQICSKENIKISSPILEQITVGADGSLRDGQTLLEQMILLSGSTEISEDIVDSFLGTIGSQQELQLLKMISERDAFPILEKIHQYFEKGKDLTKLLARLIHWTRCLLLSRASQSTSLFEKDCAPEALESLLEQFREWSTEDLDRLFEVLWTGYERIKRSDLPKICLETSLIRACRIPRTMDLARLIEHLESSPPVSAKTSAPPAPMPQARLAPKGSKPSSPTRQPSAPLKETAEDWESALVVLKRKRPSLQALVQCAEKQELNGNELTLIFSQGHFAYKQLSDPLMMKDFERTISEILKQKLQIKVVEGKGAATFAPTPKTDLIIEAKKQVVEDPQIRKAAELLQGKISSVTIEGIKT